MALLEINNLTKRFGGLVANDDITLSIDQGEIVGLIGPNGAGKTTLFNCIAGFYNPEGGSIRFNGKDITNYRSDQACAAGLARTFQIVRVFKGMTVLDNVKVGSYLRSGSKSEVHKRALEVLRFTGLYPKQDMLASALTIADKKRLELARALATQPKLLMLDEVMAGLNSTECQENPNPSCPYEGSVVAKSSQYVFDVGYGNGLLPPDVQSFRSAKSAQEFLTGKFKLLP